MAILEQAKAGTFMVKNQNSQEFFDFQEKCYMQSVVGKFRSILMVMAQWLSKELMDERF